MPAEMIEVAESRVSTMQSVKAEIKAKMGELHERLDSLRQLIK